MAFPVLSSPRAGFILRTLLSTAPRSVAAFFALRKRRESYFGLFRARKRIIPRGLLFLARNRAQTEHRSSKTEEFMPPVRKLITSIALMPPPANWSGKSIWRRITRLRRQPPSAPHLWSTTIGQFFKLEESPIPAS